MSSHLTIASKLGHDIQQHTLLTKPMCWI